MRRKHPTEAHLIVLQVGNHSDDTMVYVAFGFNLKADLPSGAIVANPIGPVWFSGNLKMICLLFDLTIWLEQVDGSDIWQVSHSGFIADRPLQERAAGFTVSAPQVEARNLNIHVVDALGSSELYQSTFKLSPQQKAAAKVAHVQKLADILFENRMQVPKKPVLVSHLRKHQWTCLS